jgi:uncharacterized protein YggT (Ycf19 family)
MNTARASTEVQLLIALGAFFVLMIIVAAIRWWHDTSGDAPTRPPR